MGELFKKYMRLLPGETPSEALRGRIVREIQRFETARLRTRIFIFSAGSLLCAGGFTWALLSTIHTLSQSGFLQYSSLLLSDADAIASFWKELLVSLAATLPVTALMLALASGAGFLWSSFSLIKNARTQLTLNHVS